MEGAVISGLIAQEERELAFFFLEGEGVVCHGEVLQALGTITEPVMLGHFEDENPLSYGFDLVLDGKAVEEMVKLVLIFGGQDDEGAGEAETEIIHAGSGFAGFGFGTSGELSVFAIGSDLRLGGHGCSFVGRMARVVCGGVRLE